MFNKAGLKFAVGHFVFANMLLVLTACNSNSKKTPAATPVKKVSKYESILAKCKAVTDDTLHIYSIANIVEAKNFNYMGTVLDSVDKALLMPLISSVENNMDGNIYACYKIVIDSTHTGIIARTPAMYDDSSIKFFTLDNAADSITDFVELAEIWGDAGDALEKQTWLYKNDQQKLTAFLWQNISHDASVEDPTNTSVEETNDYFLLDLSKQKCDTISTKAENLLKTFQRLNRK